jgi:hypothetical protein
MPPRHPFDDLFTSFKINEDFQEIEDGKMDLKVDEHGVFESGKYFPKVGDPVDLDGIVTDDTVISLVTPDKRTYDGLLVTRLASGAVEKVIVGVYHVPPQLMVKERLRTDQDNGVWVSTHP